MKEKFLVLFTCAILVFSMTLIFVPNTGSEVENAKLYSTDENERNVERQVFYSIAELYQLKTEPYSVSQDEIDVTTYGDYSENIGQEEVYDEYVEPEETYYEPVEPEEVYDESVELEEEYNEAVESLDYGSYDSDMLLRIGMAEAGSESTECIANVMLVVLNRVKSDYFPNTIEDVLYQKNQFTPVGTGTFYNISPNEKCYYALEMICSGWDESQGALYFESCRDNSWHSRNLNFLFKCDGLNFYN